MAFDNSFNSNNTDDFSSNNFNDEDPAAEFLQQERQELGDITGNNDGNSLINGIDQFSLIFPFLFFSRRTFIG